MNRPISFLPLILTLLFFSCNPQEPKKIPPKVVKGVLDLRHLDMPDNSKERTNNNNYTGNSGTEPSQLDSHVSNVVEAWDFTTDGIINLDGEWEFYWGEFLEPRLDTPANSQVKTKESNPNTAGTRRPQLSELITVPGNWNSYLNNGKPVGSDGYATYRLRVLLPKSNTPLAFKILNASTAYTMYVNGEKLASNGVVGKVKESIIPQSLSIISSMQNPKEELEILFHVSNFHYSKGGLWLPVKLGSEKAVRELRDKNLFLDLFLAGSILIMGLYHLVIFIQRKVDKSPLLFGIYCFIIVVRLVSTGEKFLTTIFPEIPFQLLIKIEYLSFYLAVPVFCHFLYTIFPREGKKKILKLIWAIGILFAISVVVTATEIFTQTVNAYQIFTLLCLLYFIYLIGLAIFRKREGGKTILVGCLIIIIGVVNDILYNRNILSTGNIFPQCLLGFTFFQSIMLSMRFSKSFTQAEKPSGDLEQKSNRLEETSMELTALTENLEIKIIERTKDLEETKKEIEDINTFSHLINSLSDLNSIFREISKYFYHKFGISGTWLFLPDEKKDYLYAYKAYSYHKLSADKYDYLMNKKIPLKENDGGMLYKTFQRKKPFYLSKIPKFEFGIDNELVETLSMSSFLQVPLIRKDECIGIFSFSNLENEMKLSKNIILKIANLCSQIAGSVDTNHLLQQVKKAKQKTEDLNSLIKKLNETSDLEKIMSIILTYVKDNYNLPYYSLFTLDEKENVLKFANAILPDYISSENKKLMRSSIFSVTEKNMDSIHSRALVLKSPIFIPDIETESKTESSKAILKILKHKSFITLPIILQNSPIGTLDFFSLDSLQLKEEEITELSLLAEQLAGVIQGATLFTQVQEEKRIAQVAQRETEKQKQETEGLNQLIKSLNEELDLKVIMEKVTQYVIQNYFIQNIGLYIVDSDKKNISMFFSNFPDYVTEEERQIIYDSKISIQDEKGAHAFVYRAKKYFYIPNAQSKRALNAATLEELFVIEKLKVNSFMLIPLLLNNDVIGILDFSTHANKLQLSKEDITKLSILGEQLAGIIHGSNLFKQVQEEKEKAQIAQLETEKAKSQVEFLNEFSKVINSSNNLDVIFRHAVENLYNKIDTDIFILQLVDKGKNELCTYPIF